MSDYSVCIIFNKKGEVKYLRDDVHIWMRSILYDPDDVIQRLESASQGEGGLLTKILRI